jgi:hypothetical protein
MVYVTFDLCGESFEIRAKNLFLLLTDLRSPKKDPRRSFEAGEVVEFAHQGQGVIVGDAGKGKSLVDFAEKGARIVCSDLLTKVNSDDGDGDNKASDVESPSGQLRSKFKRAKKQVLTLDEYMLQVRRNVAWAELIMNSGSDNSPLGEMLRQEEGEEATEEEKPRGMLRPRRCTSTAC